MNIIATLDRLTANATRLGHPTQVVAGALTIVGIAAASLCCWCAESVDGEVRRVPHGGECDRCPYVGRDTLVVVPS